MTASQEPVLDPGAAPDDLAAARRVLDMESAALVKLSASLDARFTAAVDSLARVAGRVVVTGMGKSGHIARKIAATMASTTGMNLGFQNGFPTQILSGLAGFLGATSQSAWRNRYTVTSKDLFGLVLVDLHWFSWTATSQTTPRPLAGRGQEVIGNHVLEPGQP